MDSVARIHVAWELRQAGQKAEYIAERVGVDRATVYRWFAGIRQRGIQGPMVADFAFLRVVAGRDGLPGPDVWLLVRRSLGAEPELKTFLSNAPVDTPLADLMPVSALRWPVELSIEECKGGLGMDRYEVRSWLGWHHHCATWCGCTSYSLATCPRVFSSRKTSRTTWALNSAV